MKILFTIIGFLFLPLASHAANAGDVVINEIAWMGTENSYADEWIELYNTTDLEISLDGWVLKSQDDIPNIVLGGNVPPGEFFLLERTDETTVPSITADQIYTGVLENSGEHLQLFDGENNLIDEVSALEGWPAGDKSTKRTMEFKNSTWTTSQNAGGTTGEQNSDAESSPPPPPPPDDPPTEDPPADSSTSIEDPLVNEPLPDPENIPSTEEGQPAPDENNSSETNQMPDSFSENIFINEIMPSPAGSDSKEEWIEIHNTSEEHTELSSWQVRDMAGATNTYTFSEGTIIPSGAFLVLYRPSTKITLNNDGDGLELVWPNGAVADFTLYEEAPEGKSYSRQGDVWLWSDSPTPWLENIIPKPEQEPVSNMAVSIQKTPEATSVQKDNTKELANVTKPQPTTTKQAVMNKNLAAIGAQDNIPEDNLLKYIIAPLLALISGFFIFILKRRLRD